MSGNNNQGKPGAAATIDPERERAIVRAVGADRFVVTLLVPCAEEDCPPILFRYPPADWFTASRVAGRFCPEMCAEILPAIGAALEIPEMVPFAAFDAAGVPSKRRAFQLRAN